MASVTVAAALVFGLSEVADWRRRNRKDVDNVGFMPWRGVSLGAAATAILSAALWIHSSGGL